jgi:hypothetical protein
MRNRLLQPPALAGLVTVLVSVWVLLSKWGPLAAGHPSYLIFYSVTVFFGLASVVAASRRKEPISAARSTLIAVALIVTSFAAWWLAPFGAAQEALDVLDRPEGFAVVDSSSAIVLEPQGSEPEVSLTFYPGARVDARAYASILSPLARNGIEVTILKPPLGIAFLVSGVSRPDTEAWVLGGHSLGGVAASGAVDRGADGLLLWASFPAADISDRTEVGVTSISGSEDALVTPDDLMTSVADLPPETVFVEVEGAIHSYFGDYGLQPGDGDPTVGRDQAQDEIVGASLELLRSLGGE